jgi:GNAT superfamily N-acetyltransferase
VVALISELDRLMTRLYPAESNHLLDVTALEQPDIRFFVARNGGVIVGCGAYRVLDSRHGEIKRMFVAPGARGTGLGLTVSRKILKEHHGDIRAESQLGAGSIFTLEFPLLLAGDAHRGVDRPDDGDGDEGPGPETIPGGQASHQTFSHHDLGPRESPPLPRP